MSYVTARNTISSQRTFYEGELLLKTGRIQKTKIFATILNHDSSLYIIDQKYLPKTADGMLPDRVDPYS